jgi:hypothetical protein
LSLKTQKQKEAVDVALALIFSFKIKLKLLKMMRRLVKGSQMMFNKGTKTASGETNLKSETKSSGKIS